MMSNNEKTIFSTSTSVAWMSTTPEPPIDSSPSMTMGGLIRVSEPLPTWFVSSVLRPLGPAGVDSRAPEA